MIHASAVIDGEFHVALSGTTIFDDVPLKVAEVPNGPVAPNVTEVAAPFTAVDPELTTAVAPTLSLSLQNPVGASAVTDARYEVELSLPESAIDPGAEFDDPGADA